MNKSLLYFFLIIFLIYSFHVHKVHATKEFCEEKSVEHAGFGKNQNGVFLKVSSRAKHKIYAYDCYRDNDIIGYLKPYKQYRIVEGNYNINYRGKRWSLLISENNGIFDKELLIGWVTHSDLRFEIESKDKKNRHHQIPEKNKISQKHMFPYNSNNFCFKNKKNIQSFEKDKEGTTFHVWIVKNDVKAYNCPGKNALNTKINMRNRYCIVEGNYRKEHNGKNWSLLTTGPTGIKTIIGWIDHENLSFNSRPLKNEMTGIDEKVLIREGDTSDGKGLKLYSDCNLEKPETYTEDNKTITRAIHVRTVFYVYDYFPQDSGKPESDKTKSLLISPDVLLNKQRMNAPMLLGWVDRKKVTFWNNREACEIPVGNRLVLKDLSGKDVIFKSDIINKPLPYNTLRNPIIEKFDNYLKIGVFAELDPQQLMLRGQMENIETGLEVLFVIDGTRSMTKAFEGTLNAVEKIAYTLENKAKVLKLEKPRLGMLFYRDTPSISPIQIINGQKRSADKHYCKKEVTNYPLGDIKRLKKQLNNQIACDSDTTPQESVYKGLIEGIKKCGFHTGANNKPTRMRIIIHIGDAGDNNRGRFSYSDVASVIEEYGIYNYIAMDVSGKSNSGFKKSIKPIVDRLNQSGEKNSVFDIVNVYDLESRVYSHLSTSQKNTERLNEQIKIMSRGFAGTAEGKAGVVSQKILTLAKKVIEANNFDLNQYEPFQHYIEGYIDINTHLKKYLFVVRNDISIVNSFLTQLIQSENITTKKNAWNSYLKLILGNEDCKDINGDPLSIRDCNRKQNGIPIAAGFTRFTRNDFINLGPDEANEVICEAKQASERFFFLGADKGITITMINRDVCEFLTTPILDLNNDGLIVKDGSVREDGKPLRNADDSDLKDLFFFKEGDTAVAWIPLEYLGKDIQDMY